MPAPEHWLQLTHWLEEVLHDVFPDLAAHLRADFARCPVVYAIVDARVDDSVTISESRLKLRVTPGAVGVVILTVGIASPKKALRTEAADDSEMQWAHGYSGCIGVGMSGSQAASRSVASFPSMSPLRIAVTGRQKL
jgi:hypothetical protein